MFQEKERMVYQRIKAPLELKNRIQKSVEQQRKKVMRQRTIVAATAACMAGVILSGGWMHAQNSIVSVNDMPVSYYRAVNLDNCSGYGIVVASGGRSDDYSIQVPLEIDVAELAHICVSEGSLQLLTESGQWSDEVQEMDISQPTLVYWRVEGIENSLSTCTITTEEEEYTYVIEFDSKKSIFKMKQTK